MVRAILHEGEIREAIGLPGNGDLVVESVAALDEPDDHRLYWFDGAAPDPALESVARHTGCIVIVPEGFAAAGDLGTCRVLEVPDPRAAIAKVLRLILTTHRQPPLVDNREIAPDATVATQAMVEGNVRIGPGVPIGPYCTVGPDVAIGSGSVLEPGVRVYRRVSIGEESTIGANSVIGNDGYGFVRDDAGNKTRMPQLAGVVIGSHVEVGALTAVESGAIKPTTIEDHAKLADLVFLGHGVRVEKSASVTAGVILAGSSVVGTEAWLGVNSSVRDSRRVGSEALVGMDVSVQDDLGDGAIARAPRPDVATRPSDDDRAAIGFAHRARPPSS